MRRLIFLLLLVSEFAQAQTFPDSTRQVGGISVTLQWNYKGANASNGAYQFYNPLVNKYFGIYSAYQSDLRYAPISGGGYVPITRLVSTTTPLQGGGNLGSNLSLSILQASTSQSGYLSNTDWNTFNNKQPALGYTPEDVANKTATQSSSTTTYPNWLGVTNYVTGLGTAYVPYTYLGWTSPVKLGADSTGVVDATSYFRTAIAAGLNIYLQQGTYLISDSLVLRSGQQIYSENAIINFTGSAKSLFVMNGLTKAVLAGKLTIVGNGNSVGTQDAVHISGGNSNDISGITFTNMSGYGILITNNSSTNFTRGNSVIVHDCFFVNNYYGLYIAPRNTDGVEYNTFANCNFRSNTFPIKTFAGNQKFIGLNVIDNVNGVYVDGSGTNAAHDTWTACNISHNTNYNVYLTGITLGESFSNCNSYGSVSAGITVVTSVGVSFQGGSIDGILSVDGTSLVTLTSVKQAPSFTIPTNSTRVTQTGNFTLTGPVNETNKLQIGSVVDNGGTMLVNTTPTTGYVNVYDVSNTSGHIKSALEGSSAGTVATGTAAYSGFIGTTNSTKFHIGTNNSVGMTFDPAQTLSGSGVIFGQNATARSAAVEISKNITALEPGFAVSSILTRSANTSSALSDFTAGSSLSATFAANVTNSTAGVQGFFANQSIASGATGTVSAIVGFRSLFANSSAMNIAAIKGAVFEAPTNSGGGTISNSLGVAIDNLTNGTNNTLLRLGATTNASGNWGEYNSSTYANHIAGNLQLGSTTATAGAEKLQVTGTANVTSTLLVGGTITNTGLAAGSAGNFVVNGGSGLLSTRTAAQTLSDIAAFPAIGGVTTTAGLGNNMTNGGYILTQTAGSNTSIWSTSKTIFSSGSTTDAVMYVYDAAQPFKIATGGSVRVTVASTGATTYTSTVTASSLIKSGSTSSKFLFGDGSDGTALPSGTTATTQSASDNSTKVATTAYVDASHGFTFRGSGQTTLVSGTKAISVTGVTASSQVFVNSISQGGTVSTTFEYAAVPTSGTITITALTNGNITNTLDTSVLSYMVIN